MGRLDLGPGGESLYKHLIEDHGCLFTSADERKMDINFLTEVHKRHHIEDTYECPTCEAEHDHPINPNIKHNHGISPATSVMDECPKCGCFTQPTVKEIRPVMSTITMNPLTLGRMILWLCCDMCGHFFEGVIEVED